LLQRQTGRRGVCFGATVSGRAAGVLGSEEMVGLFINTLAVVEGPRGEERAGEWLRGLQEHNVRLREHEEASLGEVQKWWGRAGQALFDTLVVFENYPVGEALRERSGGEVEFGEVEAKERTHYALTLVVTTGGEGLELRYRHAGVGAARVEAIAEQVEHLLGELTADGGRRLGELTAWSGGKRAERVGRARGAEWLHERIAEQARRQPGAVAVRQGTESLTYGELEERANRVARVLRARGAGRERLVGLCVSRSVRQVVGLLGIVKAGAGYVPVDGKQPPERVKYQLESSGAGLGVAEEGGAALVVTEEGAWSVLPSSVEAWCIDRDWSEAAAESGSALGVPVGGEQVVYCLYTSGSTGRPKGVDITHGGLSHYLGWALEAYEVSAGERSAVHSSVGFDLTVTSLWLPLCAGGVVELAEEVDDGVSALAGVLSETGGVELLKLTPSHALGLSEVVSEPLWKVKTLVVGGEALTWEHVSALRSEERR